MVQTQQNPKWLVLREQASTPDDILRGFEVLQPPVPVEDLVRRMGIELHMVTHPGWDGAVKSSPERAAIWLDAGKPRVRRRFTLAHELGHLMLHPLGEEFRDLADPTRPTHSYREKQANRFAAELLMPSWMLPPYVEAADGKINVLAQIFQVSTAAMTIRLETLHGPRTL